MYCMLGMIPAAPPGVGPSGTQTQTNPDNCLSVSIDPYASLWDAGNIHPRLACMWGGALIRIHSWLLIVVAVLIAAAPVAAKVDPGLVGAWFVMTSNSQGALLVTLDIKADGSYVIRGEGVGAPPPRTGRFDAANGTFTMTGTPGDSGTCLLYTSDAADE